MMRSTISPSKSGVLRWGWLSEPAWVQGNSRAGTQTASEKRPHHRARGSARLRAPSVPPGARASALAYLLLATIASAASVGTTLEDPVARAALPEFKYIPAAKPEELTPATEVPS